MIDEREQFIRDNAMQLVRERDCKIARQRETIKKLQRRCNALRQLNESLAERVAAQSEVLARKSERQTR